MIIIEPITRETALEAVSQIKHHLKSASAHLAQAYHIYLDYERCAMWKTLGYANKMDAAQPLFDLSYSQVQRLIKAGQFAAETGITLPHESHVRQLAKLTDPAKAQTALDLAEQIARSEGVKDVVARHIAAAVEDVNEGAENYRKDVYVSGFSPVIQWMNQGKLTPKQAWSTSYALNEVASKVRDDVLLKEVTAPTLIRELNRIAGSATYQELMASGCIQLENGSVPLSAATPGHLRTYLDAKAREHRQQALDESAGEPVSCVLFPQNMTATLAELRKYISEAQLQELAQLIAESS